jgi:hypothetical protein
MARKKIAIIASILFAALLLFGVLLLLSQPRPEALGFDESAGQNGNENITAEFICQRIEDFTIRFLRDAETVNATWQESGISVAAALFLETDSKLIIKEAIYEEIANHALQITRFFPEANFFYYSVWEGNPKREVMTLTLDEHSIKTLEANFSINTDKKEIGIETAFVDIFSTAVEKKTALSWQKNFDEAIKLNEMESKIEKEVIINRIEAFSKRYFRHLEMAQAVFENGGISVSASFEPSVGSFPIKEEIYEDIVNHALRVRKFFPEAKFFSYSVLWKGHEVITLTIENEEIKWLEDNWFSSVINRNGGFKTSFVDCFTTVVEAGEAIRWISHLLIDPDALTP